MARHVIVVNVSSMSTHTLRPIADERIQSLDERHSELEHHVARFSAAVRDCNGHNPSLGRELDAARSRLAQVRAERARLLAGRTAGTR